MRGGMRDYTFHGRALARQFLGDPCGAGCGIALFRIAHAFVQPTPISIPCGAGCGISLHDSANKRQRLAKAYALARLCCMELLLGHMPLPSSHMPLPSSAAQQRQGICPCQALLHNNANNSHGLCCTTAHRARTYTLATASRVRAGQPRPCRHAHLSPSSMTLCTTITGCGSRPVLITICRRRSLTLRANLLSCSWSMDWMVLSPNKHAKHPSSSSGSL